MHVRAISKARLEFRETAINLIDGGWNDMDELRPRMEDLKAAYEALEHVEGDTE